MSVIKTNKDVIMFVISVIPFLILDSSLLYAYSIAFVGGWIGYNKSYYKFKYPKSTEKIMEENANDENYGYVLFYFVIVSVLLVVTEYASFVSSENAFIAMILFTTLVCLFFISLFNDMYEQVYSHASPTKSSTRYVIPSKIAMLFAVSSVLITQELAWYSVIAFYVPLVVYLRFTWYLNRDNDAKYSFTKKQFVANNRKFLRDKSSAEDGLKPLVNDLEFEYNATEDSAIMNMYYSVELPDDLYHKGALENFAKSTYHTHELIDSMKTIDNMSTEKAQEFLEFYKNVARIVGFKVIEFNEENSGPDVSIDFDELPYEVGMRIIGEVINSDEYSIDDLGVDHSTLFELKSDEDMSNDYSLDNIGDELDRLSKESESNTESESDDNEDDYEYDNNEDFDYIDL